MHCQLEEKKINFVLKSSLINSEIVNCNELIIFHDCTEVLEATASHFYSLIEGKQVCASWH